MSKIQWKKHRFGDKVRLLSGGTPSKRISEYWNGDIPWVSPKDMKVGRLYDTEDHISELGAANGTRLVPAGTIFIVVRGMILANDFPVSMAMRTLAFNQDIKALELADDVDSHFMYYWLLENSYELRGLADEAAHGTKRIQSDRLESFPLRLPPYEIQLKIADILSNYDDLIEINKRRIQVLEQASTDLYQEWFVHFRFPGYEGKSEESNLSTRTPDQWETKSFSQIAEFINGFAFKPWHWGDSGKPIVKIAELKGGITVKTPFNDGDKVPSRYHITSGDLLFSWSAHLDAYIWLHGDALLNQHIFLVVPFAENDKYFVYFSLKKEMDYFRQMSLGTTMKHIKRSALDYVKTLVPPYEYRVMFSEKVTPMFDQIITLSERNRQLRHTRDLLLPGVITGNIDISNLTLDTEEVLEI